MGDYVSERESFIRLLLTSAVGQDLKRSLICNLYQHTTLLKLPITSRTYKLEQKKGKSRVRFSL